MDVDIPDKMRNRGGDGAMAGWWSPRFTFARGSTLPRVPPPAGLPLLGRRDSLEESVGKSSESCRGGGDVAATLSCWRVGLDE